MRTKTYNKAIELLKAGNTEEVIQILESEKNYVTCLSLHKDDIKSCGYDPTNLTEYDMQCLADVIGEAYMDSFWDTIDTIAELSKLEKL